ncbi:Dabb family protein [Rhodococcus sp. NPDC047139]|uniref:Dabb family protein n=1 Tax=Rhodococcus sp. NPDC047139 TaxID=3155141 RepID=UPI0033FB3186
MFNHVGHLTLVPHATSAHIGGIVDALLDLPEHIEGLVSAQVVRDAGLVEGNATLRFHMRFGSRDDWAAYRTHPAHVAVVTERIGPILESKSFVQYDDSEVCETGSASV